MEVQIAADGIILMRRVHRRHTQHTLTRLHIPGTLGPLATLTITHNTLWSGRRRLNYTTHSP